MSATALHDTVIMWTHAVTRHMQGFLEDFGVGGWMWTHAVTRHRQGFLEDFGVGGGCGHML